MAKRVNRKSVAIANKKTREDEEECDLTKFVNDGWALITQDSLCVQPKLDQLLPTQSTVNPEVWRKLMHPLGTDVLDIIMDTVFWDLFCTILQGKMNVKMANLSLESQKHYSKPLTADECRTYFLTHLLAGSYRSQVTYWERCVQSFTRKKSKIDNQTLSSHHKQLCLLQWRNQKSLLYSLRQLTKCMVWWIVCCCWWVYNRFCKTNERCCIECWAGRWSNSTPLYSKEATSKLSLCMDMLYNFYKYWPTILFELVSWSYCSNSNCWRSFVSLPPPIFRQYWSLHSRCCLSRNSDSSCTSDWRVISNSIS